MHYHIVWHKTCTQQRLVAHAMPRTIIKMCIVEVRLLKQLDLTPFKMYMSVSSDTQNELQLNL